MTDVSIMYDEFSPDALTTVRGPNRAQENSKLSGGG